MRRLLGDSVVRFPSTERPGGWFPPVDLLEEADQIVPKAEEAMPRKIKVQNS